MTFSKFLTYDSLINIFLPFSALWWVPIINQNDGIKNIPDKDEKFSFATLALTYLFILRTTFLKIYNINKRIISLIQF